MYLFKKGKKKKMVGGGWGWVSGCGTCTNMGNQIQLGRTINKSSETKKLCTFCVFDYN